MGNKQINKKAVILNIGVIISIIVAIYTILTYGQAVIHTDCATGNNLCKSIIGNKSLFPKTWNYNNGEIPLFSIITVSAFFHAIIPNTIIARTLASAFWVSCACLSIVWLSKKVFSNLSYTLIIPIILVIICGSEYRDMILFQGAYTSMLIVVTMGVGLAYYLFVLRESNVTITAIFCSFLFVLMVGGIRFIAEFLLPLVCMIGINWLIDCREGNPPKLGCLCKTIVIIALPTIAGILLYKYICYSHAGHMYSTSASSINIEYSINQLLLNTQASLRNLFSIFGYVSGGSVFKNIVAIVLSVILVVLCPIISIFEYRSMNRAEKSYFIFGIVHNILLIGAIIVSSKLYERYLLSSVFVAIVISASFITKCIHNRGEKNIYSDATVILFFSLILIYSINIFHSTFGWKEMVDEQKRVCQILIDKGIKHGYASPWVAYPQEIYSNNKLTFGAINIGTRNIQKWYRLVDDNAFAPIDGRSCLIMTEEEAEGCRNAVSIVVGLWDEEFVIEDAYVSDNGVYRKTNLIVFCFDEDIADKISNGFRDGIIDIKEVDFNWYGTMTDDSYILDQNGLVHGPFSYLDEGQYSVRIEGENLIGCNCAVVSGNAQNSIEYNIVDIENNYIDIDVILKKGVEDLQIYLANPKDNSPAIFYKVYVNKI